MRTAALTALLLTTMTIPTVSGGDEPQGSKSSGTSLMLHPNVGVTLYPDRGTVAIYAGLPDRTGAWTVGGPDGPPLWRLGWQDAQGGRRELSAGPDAPPARVETRGARSEIEWRVALAEPNDTVVVASVDSDDGGTLRWRLEVRTDAEGWRLRDVDFPVIGGIPGANARMAQPHGWGVLRANLLEGGPLRCNYPGFHASMQFLGLETPEGLIYLAAEDPDVYQKFLLASPDKEHGTISLLISQFPELDPDNPGVWRTPFPTATAVIPGATWVEAATRYREWTAAAPWGKCRLESGRVPDWMAENDLWVLYEDGAVDATSAAQLRKWKETFGVPSAAHWYRWHEIPFDTLYPEYFPPKAGSLEAMRAAQEAGIPVMPYINGRLWDVASDSWRVRNASAAATVDDKGNVRTEVYGTKIPLAVMCPSTELWQTTVSGLVRRLVREMNVDAVYIDQIGVADAVRCDATGHPHQPGGGNYWARGYRELLTRCRKELGRNRAITTEECAEPWNDLIDGFLMVNTLGGIGEIIPLYPMVYGGRTVYFGFQYYAQQEMDQGPPLRAKLARTFVWGGQIGWVRRAIVDPKHATEAAFLRELGRIRSRAHPYLQHGRMLPSPLISGAEILEVTTYAVNGFRPEKIPAVVNGLWQADDGSTGLALANWSDTPQKLTIAAFTDQGPPTVITEGELPPPVLTDGGWNLELLSRRAALLIWH